MRLRVNTILLAVVLCLAPTTGWCDLAPYSQDFEGLDPSDPAALANDGWLVFGNVFNADGSYAYGYGSFPAPNGGAAFSAIVSGEGGPAQGAQQLSVYSDYNNGDHGNGRFIEANVFQERTVGAADVGTTWLFEFDAKRGNIEGLTTALAFFKTIDPNAGFALTNFIVVDMTNIPDAWDRYGLAIFIDPSLVGQFLQFGFLSTATAFEGSGVFYDNVVFRRQPLSVPLDIKPGSCPNPINTRAGRLPVALLGTGDLDVTEIDVASLQLEGVAPVKWNYDDVGEPFTGDLCGCVESGPDGFLDLTLKFDLRELVDALIWLAPGAQPLTLTGALLDGTPIEAQDCILIVGGHGSIPGPPTGVILPPVSIVVPED